MLLDSFKRVMKSGFNILALVINGYQEQFCVAQIPFKALTEKEPVKKYVDHMQKKESLIKDEIYSEMQLEKWDLYRNETTVNSPVTTNNPSQNISNPRTQKQLRTQIRNIPQ